MLLNSRLSSLFVHPSHIHPNPPSVKHFFTTFTQRLQTCLLMESLNHAVWPRAGAIGWRVHSLNSCAAEAEGDGDWPCCHKTCWLERFACFPLAQRNVCKRWPKPYIILHSSVPKTFVHGEVTWAKRAFSSQIRAKRPYEMPFLWCVVALLDVRTVQLMAWNFRCS